MKKSLISAIFEGSDTIKNNRDITKVIEYGFTEYGELAMEAIIERGHSYKAPGSDGVIGEALDVIVCMADVIRVHSPHLTEEDLIKIVEPKIKKWRDNSHNEKLFARREHGPHHNPDVGGTYAGWWVVRDIKGTVFDWCQYKNDLIGRYDNIQFFET